MITQCLNWNTENSPSSKCCPVGLMLKDPKLKHMEYAYREMCLATLALIFWLVLDCHYSHVKS